MRGGSSEAGHAEHSNNSSPVIKSVSARQIASGQSMASLVVFPFCVIVSIFRKLDSKSDARGCQPRRTITETSQIHNWRGR